MAWNYRPTYRYGPNLTLSGNLSWQDALSLRRTVDFYRRQLPGEARISAYSRLRYDIRPWQWWYEVSARRGSYYDRANLLPVRDHVQQNVGMNWSNQSWKVQFAINNLENVAVEDFNGFPKPGRSWHVFLTRTL